MNRDQYVFFLASASRNMRRKMGAAEIAIRATANFLADSSIEAAPSADETSSRFQRDPRRKPDELIFILLPPSGITGTTAPQGGIFASISLALWLAPKTAHSIDRYK